MQIRQTGDRPRRFFYFFLAGLSLSGLSPLPAAPASGSGPGSLRMFLSREGYAGAPLHRRYGNHLFVAAAINNQRTALMIDTGAPHTLIDKNSVSRLRLQVERTNLRVGDVFGWTRERFGVSRLDTLAMGNCVLTNVPVTIADESEINHYTRLSHLDGLFGAHEMLKFGMVIDCARQMLYVDPHGGNGDTSRKLAGFLARRGFFRIPMRYTSDRHFDVAAAINGHPVRLLVDTGAGTSLLANQTAAQAGVAFTALSQTANARGGRVARITEGKVKELVVGGFKIKNADIAITDIAAEVGAGLLGEEYLSWNFAVIDVAGLALYLRHPDPR